MAVVLNPRGAGRRRAGVVLVLGLSLAGLVAWAWWTARGSAQMPPGAGAAAALPWREAVAQLDQGGAAQAARPSFHTGLEQLPPSLQGVQVPDELVVDAQGRLVLNEALRRVFDHFLAAQGEEPGADTVARLRAWLTHRLPAPAAVRALSVLSSYLAYQDALRDLPAAQASAEAASDVADVRQRLAQVRSLRSQHMDSETVQAFFADEDALADHRLMRMAVLRDQSLSPAERAARLQEARDRLSPAQRAQIDVLTQVEDLQVATQALQARGGSEAELRSLRQSIVGEEATQRLEVLDQSRAQWQTRVAAFRTERDALMADASLSEPQRQERLRAVVARDFSPAEALRLAIVP